MATHTTRNTCNHQLGAFLCVHLLNSPWHRRHPCLHPRTTCRCSELRARRLAPLHGAAGTRAASGESEWTRRIVDPSSLSLTHHRSAEVPLCRPCTSIARITQRLLCSSSCPSSSAALCPHAVDERVCADARTLHPRRSLAAPAPVAGARVAQRFGEPRWYR